MPTIVLQSTKSDSKGKDRLGVALLSATASVSAAPGRYHYATVDGKARTFELVGVDSSGQQIFRDQTRY